MRAKHKNRIRKSSKYLYIIIAVALIALSIFHFITNVGSESNTSKKTQQIYSYTNKFGYNYKVNLKDNEYTQGMNTDDKSLAFITSLIDNIQLQLDYEYKGDKSSSLVYDYEVIGRTQAVYTKDGEEQKIIEKNDTLLEKKEESKQDNNIKISEGIELDLEENNNLLNELKKDIGISFAATYSVIMKVNVKTEVDGETVSSNYSPVITIDLAEKTTKIKGDNNKEEKQYIAKQIPRTGKGPSVLLDIVILVIGIFIFRYAINSKVANIVRNEYKHELNRLLKLCQDKIVRVNTKPDTNMSNVVLVKDFGEIVKLSEELFKPILCYIDETQDEAWFSVMSNSVDYRYVLMK